MNPRVKSLTLTGGRTPSMRPQTAGPINQSNAPEPAGPGLNVNQVKLTDVDIPRWMHGFFGHSCGCGENKNGD